MPAATLAAEPPLDPPGDRVASIRIARRTERASPRWSCRTRTREGWSCRSGRRRRRAAGRSPARRLRRRDLRARGRPRSSATPATSNRSLSEIGTPCSGPRSTPASQLAIGGGGLLPRLVRHHEDERIQAAVVSARCARRHCSVTSTRRDVAGAQPARELIDVHGSFASRPGNAVGCAQRLRCLRQAFEQRLQLGQPAPFGVGDRRFQPARCHGRYRSLIRFTEIATPSRSGTVAVRAADARSGVRCTRRWRGCRRRLSRVLRRSRARPRRPTARCP